MKNPLKSRLMAYLAAPIILASASAARPTEAEARYITSPGYIPKEHVSLEKTLGDYVSRDDPKAVLEFIKPDDKMNEFVQESLSGLKNSDTLDKLMALYESFALYGVKPGIPEKENLENQNPDTRVIGNFRYASSIFDDKNKERSCKNLAVIYASALRCLNIDSTLVSIPEHMFLLVKYSNEEAKKNGIDDTWLLHLGEEVYLPIDTSYIGGDNFMKAWKMGAMKYATHHIYGDIFGHEQKVAIDIPSQSFSQSNEVQTPLAALINENQANEPIRKYKKPLKFKFNLSPVQRANTDL